jgi:hypothetical protein
MSEQPNTEQIPPLPGGGSWTYDEINRRWDSNDPAPQAPTEQPAAGEQATTTE